MRLIDADAIKQKYKDKFIKSLVNKDRGIDLSEYAEEPSKSFNRFIDEMPTVDVLERISDEVNKLKKVSDGNSVYVGINDVFDIIDKYKAESEE